MATLQPGGASYDQANRGVIDRWVSPKGDGSDEIPWQYAVGLGIVYAPDGTRTEQALYAERGLGSAVKRITGSAGHDALRHHT